MHIPSQILAYTPEDSRIEPENTGLVQMIYIFPGGPYSQVNQPLIFRGVPFLP